MSYEYKVVPAPMRGTKAKGRKTSEDRFAHALEGVMNDLAREGWEFLRSDTLPCEQREGLLSKTTVYHNMLVFRRGTAEAEVIEPRVMPARLDAPRREPQPPKPVWEAQADQDDGEPPATREA